MNKKTPTFSICIPTFNRESYLPIAINSVLEQTYKNFELIICNDASTDSTDAVVKNISDPRLIYTRNKKNLGYISSMNKCTKMAHGEWIIHLSDDDIMMPQMLEKVVKVITDLHGKNVGFIVPQSTNINSEGNIISVPSRQLSKEYLLLKEKEFIPNYTQYGRKIRGKYQFNTSFPSTVFNRKILIEQGMSSVEVPVSHDVLLGAKICLLYPIVVIDEPLLHYRVHQNWGSSLNRRGEFLKEYTTYLKLLLHFVKKKNISFPYDFEKYIFNALNSYLFAINGGLVRLAARYDGTYVERVKKVNEYIKYGLSYNKGNLINLRFYFSVFLSYLPQIILLECGKLFKQI